MSPRTRQITGWAAGSGVVVSIGWLIAGPIGIVASVVGLVLAAVAGPRWVAAAALFAFITSAVATLAVPLPSTDVSKPQFTHERTFASEAARIAGVLVVVAIAGFAARERDRRGTSATALERAPREKTAE